MVQAVCQNSKRKSAAMSLLQPPLQPGILPPSRGASIVINDDCNPVQLADLLWTS